MAAAEYYGGGGTPQAPAVQAPRPQQQQPYAPRHSSNNLPYPISDAPPPYSAFVDQPRPHSQPPPQSRPQNHVNFAPTNGYGPPPTHAYPPDKSGYRPQNTSNLPPPPQQYGPPPQPQMAPGYPYPNGLQPPPMGEPSRRSSGSSAYRPAVTPYQDDYVYDSRSLSRDRKKHHHHHHRDPSPRNSKKKDKTSTFLGAGGGALIGDLIFPGLGTIGGAILGGMGGHEYSKQQRSYSNDARSRSYHGSRDDGYDEGRGRRGGGY
ncbi:hypothetical protein LTR62_003450 [Meristemomyces frigidus]|uniref:Glycine zipper 2TM domain-containing protein n=1 Tax=Meristemomyces frigidus TaxID=1508187 RepID=A0AAN7YPN1_9PEZI|nr:hypothetical protein LTR62_003450 [Meristemomyces frigidus]